MAGTLFNIRLDASDAARVRRLREEGVQLSQIVREAIRDAYEKRGSNGLRSKGSARKILQAIYERHPIPDGVPPPGIDLSDRHAVSRAILNHLRRKRK